MPAESRDHGGKWGTQEVADVAAAAAVVGRTAQRARRLGVGAQRGNGDVAILVIRSVRVCAARTTTGVLRLICTLPASIYIGSERSKPTHT